MATKKDKQNISRRQFVLKTAAAIGGTLIGYSLLSSSCDGDLPWDKTETVTTTAPGPTITTTVTQTQTTTTTTTDIATTGIEHCCINGEILTDDQFKAIRGTLAGSIEWPEVTLQESIVETGDLISFDSFSLPRLDFFKLELKYKKYNMADHPIIASFEGINGPVMNIVRQENDKFTISIPEEASYGALILKIPVEEYYGPSEILKEMKYEKELFDREFRGLIAGQNTDGSDGLCTGEEALDILDRFGESINYKRVFYNAIPVAALNVFYGGCYGSLL